MTTLLRYIEVGKVPAPEALKVGRYQVRAWHDSDIEKVREILPKIANGRKHRKKKARTTGKKK